MLTCEPQSAPDPKTFGLLLFAANEGLVPARLGVPAGVVSLPTIRAFEQVVDWPSGFVIVIEANPAVAPEVSRSSVRWVGSVTVTSSTTTPLLTVAEMCS